jgi:CheY-like chemotaxis protein
MDPTALLAAGVTFVATSIAKEAADDLVKQAWIKIKDAIRPLLGREPVPADLGTPEVRIAASSAPPVQIALRSLWGSTAVLKRAELVDSCLRGARVLWVDDHPAANVLERQWLTQLGVQVTTVESTDSALECMRSEAFDLILSDIDRPGSRTAGLESLPRIKSIAPTVAVIFYVMRLEPRGVPPDAFGITARPDELFHLCMDALERTRL